MNKQPKDGCRCAEIAQMSLKQPNGTETSCEALVYPIARLLTEGGITTLLSGSSDGLWLLLEGSTTEEQVGRVLEEKYSTLLGVAQFTRIPFSGIENPGKAGAHMLEPKDGEQNTVLMVQFYIEPDSYYYENVLGGRYCNSLHHNSKLEC